MLWSILILTQPGRERFLARLMAVLKPQAAEHVDIEIIVRIFDPQFDLGTNRQIMIDGARGTYCCFIDDDDLVSASYVSMIYPLLDGVDYIGFQLQMFMDGKKQVPTFHSLRYPEWTGDHKGWYRDISHLNPIRRELAMQVQMTGGPGEDHRWAEGLRHKGIVKTEHYVDEVMYLYYYRSDKATTPQQHSGSVSTAKPVVPIQSAKCDKCGSSACGLGGGMRICNQCGHSWLY